MSAELVLAVDTSTRASIVVVGGEAVQAQSCREVQHRHGSHVLEQIDEDESQSTGLAFSSALPGSHKTFCRLQSLLLLPGLAPDSH